MEVPLTLHAKFGPTTVLVDHDKQNHQQDTGEGSKSDGNGNLQGTKPESEQSQVTRVLCPVPRVG